MGNEVSHQAISAIETCRSVVTCVSRKTQTLSYILQLTSFVFTYTTNPEFANRFARQASVMPFDRSGSGIFKIKKGAVPDNT